MRLHAFTIEYCIGFLAVFIVFPFIQFKDNDALPGPIYQKGFLQVWGNISTPDESNPAWLSIKCHFYLGNITS